MVDVYREDFGVDVRPLVGGGAAGGLAGGLAAVGGDLVSGFDLVADELGLAERIERPTSSSPAKASWTRRASTARWSAGCSRWPARPAGRCWPWWARCWTGWTCPTGCSVVSLVERSGRAAALEQTAAAIEDAVRAGLTDLALTSLG